MTLELKALLAALALAVPDHPHRGDPEGHHARYREGVGDTHGQGKEASGVGSSFARGVAGAGLHCRRFACLESLRDVPTFEDMGADAVQAAAFEAWVADAARRDEQAASEMHLALSCAWIAGFRW